MVENSSPCRSGCASYSSSRHCSVADVLRGSVVAMRGLCPSRVWRGGELTRGARLPERLAAFGVRGAREDEEQVGEAVQVDERSRVEVPLARHGQHLALDAAADGARDLQARGGLGASGQDEALERLERGVAVALERVDLRL